MTARSRYLDGVAFTRLFRQRWKNHSDICLGLQRIVAGVARAFRFVSLHDRQDIESNALVEAIDRIDRFKFDRGGDAFAYYSKVIVHSIDRQITGRRRAGSRVDWPILFAQLGAPTNAKKSFLQMPNIPVLTGAVPYTRAV
jgi:hypothetical protein